MVGALDPSCSRSVFISNLSENVVRRTESAASAVANLFLLITAVNFVNEKVPRS